MMRRNNKEQKPEAAASTKRDTEAKEQHYQECKQGLLEIEGWAKAQWEIVKPYEADAPPAPTAGAPEARAKYFVTFPYPYMNGMLHLGHAFSMSKSEFTARYQRLKGKHVLWPFGLHCTGTPIAACAQKLKNEMTAFGTPPTFPDPEAAAPAATAAGGKKKELAPGQFKSNRAKVVVGKPQWQIMEAMGVDQGEIPKFADPKHWLDHFPSEALVDIQSFGLHIDFRRSFITTQENPFYDSFIRWQFRKLRAAGYLGWGKRHCVYSPMDGQPCADHDRASGEGVLPQEYCVVKLRVQNASQQPGLAEFQHIIGDKTVVLPGATLRAETVVGQTNCWVGPGICYAAFDVATSPKGNSEIWIMTTKCARNMAYQDFAVNGKVFAEPTPLFHVEGERLIGLPLSAPHAPYATIFTLPMATITEAKGTGVVMSVPSDSPDDYINFMTLVDKPEYRAKLKIQDKWVAPFAIVPILRIPNSELGDCSAKVLVDKLKIASAKDADKLEEAKKEAYSQGFYKGYMTAGPFKDKKVAEAKVLMQERMIADGDAIAYREPMKEVVSRSGDVCVVALCDQWYIEYGKAEWKAVVEEHLAGMQCYFKGIRNGFEETLNWLADWPCSRTFGLGTVLPFNKEDMVIDSLSDSTIYMAYYAVAHFFHVAADGTQTVDGRKPNKFGLTPEMVSDKTWDWVFKGEGSAEDAGVPAEIATQMRREFSYWYPVDLRVSGKDLIQNHLTMFLYNHAAIWPEEPRLWPRSVYCNGHVLVDGEKMSKGKGNFITLRDALKIYSCDATRLAIADAGDSLDDANFVTESAKGFVLKLAALVDTFKGKLARVSEMRDGPFNQFDKIFDNAINQTVATADAFYAGMSFRSAMHAVFFEAAKDESFYTLATAQVGGPHRALVHKYIETVTLLLTPITPHVCEHIWQQLLRKESSVMQEVLPATPTVDRACLAAGDLINAVIVEVRAQAARAGKKHGPVAVAHVYTAAQYLPWQLAGLEALKGLYEANGGQFPRDPKTEKDATTTQIKAAGGEWMAGASTQEVMSFIAFVRDNVVRCGPAMMSPTPLVDDAEVLLEALPFIQSHSGVAVVKIHCTNSGKDTDEPQAPIAGHALARSRARPAQPSVALPPLE